ncbi:MAG: hypothetical protein JXA69_08380 [Phycisphaerae bacterium]|nr:hypothetical protein [Phycisphaerae bacterium]
MHTMARARKPGTPGRTTIPRDAVKETTRRLTKSFKQTAEAELASLAVIAQQAYLYLETMERPFEVMPGLVAARFAKKGGARRTPLGRMVWTGNPEIWHLQLFKWSDECWDTENEAGCTGGTPEECLAEALLGWGA